MGLLLYFTLLIPWYTINITGVHSNQDLILRVKIGGIYGFLGTSWVLITYNISPPRYSMRVKKGLKAPKIKKKNITHMFVFSPFPAEPGEHFPETLPPASTQSTGRSRSRPFWGVNRYYFLTFRFRIEARTLAYTEKTGPFFMVEATQKDTNAPTNTLHAEHTQRQWQGARYVPQNSSVFYCCLYGLLA